MVSDLVPMAAPTNNLPSSSLAASGKSNDLFISLRVTRPVKLKEESTKRIFSILLSWSSFLITSKSSPSFAVTSFSLGVIISDTLAEKFCSFLKSLLVTIPTKLSSSTTGIPEILSSLVSCISSPTSLSDLIVIGSLTIPLSYFFTFLTSEA